MNVVEVRDVPQGEANIYLKAGWELLAVVPRTGMPTRYSMGRPNITIPDPYGAKGQ
jgi:hypothetical protein